MEDTDGMSPYVRYSARIEWMSTDTAGVGLYIWGRCTVGANDRSLDRLQVEAMMKDKRNVASAVP